MKTEAEVWALFEAAIREWAAHIDAGAGPAVLTRGLARSMALGSVLNLDGSKVAQYLGGVQAANERKVPA